MFVEPLNNKKEVRVALAYIEDDVNFHLMYKLETPKRTETGLKTLFDRSK